ncbi:MAG: glycoside hydrolase family 172 protein [Planctomycetota bacterium]
MRLRSWLPLFLTVPASACHAPAAPERVTLASLLLEMTSADALARLPRPSFESLQASSYNRESTRRDAPGWFADSDGVGFLREEERDGRKEWVLMEDDGPGCLTRIWTPFFYYDFGERTGPNVRIWLDGAAEPVIDEPLIRLVRGEGTIAPPFAAPTTRAGDLYLPIPYAESCRITMDRPSFYFIVNYRSFAPGVEVESFSPAAVAAAMPALAHAASELTATPALADSLASVELAPGARHVLATSTGPGAFRAFTLRLGAADARPAVLRSSVLVATFDGEETLWCPVGDFFSSADALHPFHTLRRSVAADGRLGARWVMPFAKSGELALVNLSDTPLKLEYAVERAAWNWDERSLHFHARWRPDEIVPGTPFQDWTFVDIAGEGVYVGDSWTVLNPQRNTWWGEGDEKIYVDGAFERGFPTHFGTGSEDYYGWAGGEVPTRRDEFTHPYLANVRVGGLDGTTQGYNICVRERGLDAIPFATRLRFDMEASFGTDIRGPDDHLGYTAVVFYYARPGARDDRPPAPADARAGLMNLVEGPARTRVERARR